MIHSPIHTDTPTPPLIPTPAHTQPGEYFGELALVTHRLRAASAYAVGETTCALMDVHAFERLLGPCMDVLKRNIDEYEDQLAAIFGNDKPTELRSK